MLALLLPLVEQKHVDLARLEKESMKRCGANPFAFFIYPEPRYISVLIFICVHSCEFVVGLLCLVFREVDACATTAQISQSSLQVTMLADFHFDMHFDIMLI